MATINRNLPFPAEQKAGKKRRILTEADHFVSPYMAGKHLRSEGPGAKWQLSVQGDGSKDPPFGHLSLPPAESEPPE